MTARRTAFSDRLLGLIRVLPKVRALVIGDLVADHYLYGETERISREAPVLIVRYERESIQLGGAANVAHNARTLGSRVVALGALGVDASGRAIARSIKAAGATLAAVSSRSIHTETKTRVLAGGQSTTRQQMLRIDRGQTGPLPGSVRGRLARQLQAHLGRCDVVIVSDYGAGALADETRQLLLAHAGAGALVCVDSRYALASYAGATVLKPNEPELAALTGMPVSTDAEVRAAGLVAREASGARFLLVTRGRKGMALFERGQPPLLLPPHGVAEAVDVTGAGDTVSATFALALAAGARGAEAAQLANVAGAVVVRKPGTATVSARELEAELRQGSR
jgi:D-glycero-beta-D-manno-heptose-7-phosphate kinase